ncbi:MAG: hypothetical protein K6E63_04525 [Lachnospiraceae bacterium]|nr:hypothetical protein [Lachnospiraceae bacterium]
MAFETDEEIQALIDRYTALESIVDERMHRILIKDGNPLMLITHRIKTMDSIKEKLKRKQDHYSSVYEMRDILGFRVICYLSGDVDMIAGLLAENFRVNWSKTKDKRKMIEADAFGYLSLHYICALPEAEGDLSDLWFEVQIRTILQHSWAEIEHDLGYKAAIEVPRDIRRRFSRAASLLETTDEIFADIKIRLDKYKCEVQENIKNESIDDLSFDLITLTEFTAHNSIYLDLLSEIAAITNAHITEGILENQLVLIDFLGIRTLRDMTELIRKRRELTLRLAKESLQDSELDELSSTVAYYYLFRAELIEGGYSRERVREYFMLTSKNEKIISNNTEKIMAEREKLK